ncbi:UTP--glucose-1-phosphate uridylyltransferase [Ancylostoma duodenale]|uniref:UTP--glucose-1-phosphate uridylyltransferase n=1 Tax=Ancylostoma duodenale TaxID=51022 RepID=A0A0C2BRT1_9BILA|nr:UTP--glucose-1-phosphate uridylyltransferase [Ancylostoma duodenale]
METLGALEHELAKLLTTSTQEELEKNRKELSGFRNLFSRFLRAKTHVDWTKIEPLPEGAIRGYKHLEHPSNDEVIASMLNKLVVVKLNGGLGTSMGCKGPKSVIPVRNELTFLDLTLQQIQTLNKTYGVDVPLVLMNSFNTEEDTKKVLKKYANVKVSVHTFCQSQYPRVNRETLMPIAKSLDDADVEW